MIYLFLKREQMESDFAKNYYHIHYQEFLKNAIEITKYQELGYLNAREMAYSR